MKDRLSRERRERLDALAFVWDVIDEAWEKGFHYLTVYKQREGHCRVPRGYIEDTYRLGGWVTDQRKLKNRLSQERRERLNALGFVWYPFDVDWEQGCHYLAIYSKREGHCQVPYGHIEDGFRVGQWVSDRRREKDRMSPERRQQLDEFGFVWNVRDEGWEEGFRDLTIYNEREGHCRVPKDMSKTAFGLTNGYFDSAKRKITYRRNVDQRLLDALGFIWDVLEVDWEEGFPLSCNLQ